MSYACQECGADATVTSERGFFCERCDEIDEIRAEGDRLQARLAEAETLLEWASSCLVPGEGLDDLLRAIDKWRGIKGRVTDKQAGGEQG